MSEAFPKLRDLEAFPHSEEGKAMVMLRDPSHLAEGILIVTPEVYSILPLINGKNSPLDIQVELTRRQGEIVFRELVENLLSQLDQAHFLDNENFHRHFKAVTDRYRVRRKRPAFHAGISYPSEPNDLTSLLNRFYADEKGAGLPGPTTTDSVRALVAPHIDLRLGGETYTHAYRKLAESKVPDLFVIIGTCHSGLSKLFSVSNKDFETPLGVAKVDRDFLEDLRREPGPTFSEEDLSHRSEHTIEFQLLFLQHLFKDSELRILPVLASFSYEELERRAKEQLFRSFVRGLEAAERRSRKQVCYIASVDLAHMGPRYGDAFQPDQAFIDETSRRDLQMLEYVTSCDPQGFFDYIKLEKDRRRICGFSPLYTMLNLIDGASGQVHYHSHARMDDRGSFVTYASLSFNE